MPLRSDAPVLHRLEARPPVHYYRRRTILTDSILNLRKNPAARNFSKCQKKTESQIFSKFLEPIFPDFLKSLWDTWRTSSLSRNWKKFKIQCNSFMENQKLHCFFIMFFNGNTNLKTTKKRGQTYSTSIMFFSHLRKSKNSFHHFFLSFEEKHLKH